MLIVFAFRTDACGIFYSFCFCLDVGRPFKNIFFFHLMGFLHLVKLTAVAFQVPHFNSLALTLRSALNLFEYSQEASFILLLTHPKRLSSLLNIEAIFRRRAMHEQTIFHSCYQGSNQICCNDCGTNWEWRKMLSANVMLVPAKLWVWNMTVHFWSS